METNIIWPKTESDWNKLRKIIPELKKRAKTLIEIVDYARFLFIERPINFDEKSLKILKDNKSTHSTELYTRLFILKDWERVSLETVIRSYVEETGLKLNEIAQPLRVILTGRTISPPIFDVLYALGREESLARIIDQVKFSGEILWIE